MINNLSGWKAEELSNGRDSGYKTISAGGADNILLSEHCCIAGGDNNVYPGMENDLSMMEECAIAGLKMEIAENGRKRRETLYRVRLISSAVALITLGIILLSVM